MTRARPVDAQTSALAQARLAALLDEPNEELTEPGATFSAQCDVSAHYTDPSARRSGPRSGQPVVDAIERAREFTRAHLSVVLVLLVAGLLVAAAGVGRARPVAVGAPDSKSETSVVSASASPESGGSSALPQAGTTAVSSVAPVKLAVHVIGAVKHPGVVELADGARVGEAIKAAGGLDRRANLGELNLAQHLADGQQVVVAESAGSGTKPSASSQVRDPGNGSVPAPPAPAGGSVGAPAGTVAVGKINLNTATAEQLDVLPGVGPVTVSRILAWRQEHGRFTRVEELQEVDGIGPKTFARIAPQVTV